MKIKRDIVNKFKEWKDALSPFNDEYYDGSHPDRVEAKHTGDMSVSG